MSCPIFPRLFYAQLLLFSVLCIHAPSTTHALPTPSNTTTNIFRRDVIKGPSLKNEPSGAKEMDLYRAMYDFELSTYKAQLHYSSTDNSPPYTNMKVARGDFNAQGSRAFYMFNNLNDAKKWCDYRKTVDKVKDCNVAKFRWKPPKDLRVKRWEEGTIEWKGFVRFNIDKNHYNTQNRKMPIQEQHDWIEGPISKNDKTHEYVPDSDFKMQYCLLSTSGMKHLEFKGWQLHDHDELKKKSSISKEAKGGAAHATKDEEKRKKKKRYDTPPPITHHPVQFLVPPTQTAHKPAPTGKKPSVSGIAGAVEEAALLNRMKDMPMAYKGSPV